MLHKVLRLQKTGFKNIRTAMIEERATVCAAEILS